MTALTRTADMIPLWLKPGNEAQGLPAGYSLEPGAEQLLVHGGNIADLRGELEGAGRPSFMIFDLPGEARAAEAALASRGLEGFRVESGRTLNGEGLLMMVSAGAPLEAFSAFDIQDERTRTGYQLPLRGSWEMELGEAEAILALPPADRIDLASVLARKICDAGNPNVVRALQHELESIPGASVGLPRLELADLAEDIEIDEGQDAGDLHRTILRHARSLDCSDQIDSLARRLREEFPATVRQKDYGPAGAEF
ncbi:hypothetical protein [Leisingera caerulea]|uniref:hypothetical protein n=1 Tax=Leisingera caerulea TaxID=506591 RepID=UPI00041BA524|nr:hypothetical protein [Leisingera caerulea]